MKIKKSYLYIGIIIVLLFVIIFLASANRELRNYQKALGGDQVQKNFSFVSAEIAALSVDEFLERQKYLTITYREMRPELEKDLSGTQGEFGLYFEDLTTGSWIGINERENNFVPASLLKLPNMIAVLKKVEKGEISLQDTLFLRKSDLDSRSGTLWKKGEGAKVTIEELLNYLIKESDNTAANTLKNQVLTVEEIVEAQYAMGLPAPTEEEMQKMSPKSYANILRSLYLSSYLRRTFSEKALNIMAETNFGSGIPAQLPENIVVAHKVGMAQNGGYYHDCGIVYYPHKPYLLCVMSVGSTQAEADRVISDVSRTVYDYMESQD